MNGKVVTEMGTKVKESDTITVNRKVLHFNDEKITLMLHKPSGHITSRRDPHHSETVMDLLPKEYQQLKPVGRLDKESEGLLLLSNDGALIQKLTHPKHEHQKTYEVLVKGYVQDKHLKALGSGKLKLDGYTLNPMEGSLIRRTKDRKTWIELVLNEGRKRQIRRVMDELGFPVVYLKRIAIGQLKLGKLKKGDFKVLSDSDLKKALA